MDWMKSLAQPASVYSNSATHGACVVTFTKSPQATSGVFVTKLIISSSAAPATPVAVTVTGPVNAAGQATTITIEIPANAFAPIVIDYGTHPLRCQANTDVVMTIPDLGAGVTAAGQLFGYYGPTS